MHDSSMRRSQANLQSKIPIQGELAIPDPQQKIVGTIFP